MEQRMCQDIVLVHGSWHGSWCWKKVIPLLQAEGYSPLAIDLPAHGKNRCNIVNISLDSYVDKVIATIDQIDRPVILAGHSMAGSVITQTAEYIPDKINRLIYLAAFLPENGFSLYDYALQDSGSELTGNIIIDEENNLSSLNPECISAAFYGRCSDADIEYAKANLVDEPLKPSNTPVVTTERYASVPRFYIKCLLDCAVTPSLQTKMVNAMPCREIISLNTDHSPFFSAPRELSDSIQALCNYPLL